MTEFTDGTPPLVVVMMGVSGSGKSTVAGVLAGKLSWDLEEGDDLHPPANVAKMHAGHPLTDDDRWPWLDRVAAWIRQHVDSGVPGIITCSALKQVYRDRLRAPGVAFVHLAGSHDLIDGRLNKRHGHFMPTSLLDSQFETLEPLAADEVGIVVEVGGTPREIANEIIERLGLQSADNTTTLPAVR